MKTLVCATVAATMLAAVPGMLLAQWPAYPTAGVPKTPDGKPNLSAPAPRAADGKPDLSGVWEFYRNPGPPNPAGIPPAVPPVGGLGLGPPAPVLNQFWNIGSTLKDGLPFQPWALELRKQRVANNNKDNPDAHCLPMGLMQLHTHPQPRKIIQTPGVIVILYEGNSGLRQIFTDGRPLPNNDPQPWWYGYSTGKWDGDTLVVETIGFRDDVWLDVEGSPLTSAGKMTERVRRVNYGTLEIEITVDDPKAYTKPWTVKVMQYIMLDTDLIEFICQENEKDASHLVSK
jgi:hypothetical protein